MLKKKETYEDVYQSFEWQIPEYYNMGVDVCDKHAHQRYRLALIYEDESGQVEKYTFWRLKRLSNQFANALKALGFDAGDRMGILLPQCPETGISHIAVYKIGGIVIPLFTLFGVDALEYRLINSEAKCIVTNGENLHKVLKIWDRLPHLKHVFVSCGKKEERVIAFWEAIEKGAIDFSPIKTRGPTIQRCLRTPPVQQDPLRAPFMPIGCFWDIFRGSNFPTTFSPKKMIVSGPRRTGHGSVV